MTTTSFPIVAHTLPNGLRVVVCEDHAAPVVTVNLWYDVGARHEVAGLTGLAHLFEHLMFEGSRQLAPAEHFRLITEAGGTTNATTSTERTNYFETVPADQLDVALWLEADRLGSLLEALTQESLDKQRDVVRNERRQRVENTPYGSAFGKLNALLFPVDHPYHHETIGSMEDLAAATLDDVRDFFRTYYAPNNLVVTVVGDVSPDHALERVAHYFGPIPANPAIPTPPAGDLPEPMADEAREVVVETVPDPAVFMAFRLPPEGDVKLDHLKVATAVLGTGRGSAFHRRLVQGELAKQTGTFIDRRVAGASVCVITAVPHAGVPLDKLEAAIRGELSRLAEDGPGVAELARAKAVIEREWLDHVGELEGRADEISRFSTLWGEPGLVNTRLLPVMEATADEVRAATEAFLVKAAPAVLWYEPAASEGQER